MNKIDFVKGAVFKKLGLRKDSVDNRLICQKKIYLLQSLGVNFSYVFNWETHGPYSPELSEYIYAQFDVLMSEDYSDIRLKETVDNKINKVNALSDKKGSELRVASWYELLASILYINNNKDSWKIENKDSLYRTLISYKPQYNKKQFDNAYDILRDSYFL